MRREIESHDWKDPDGVYALPVSITAYYGVQAPDGGIDNETRVLVALHGWGQNSQSFLRKLTFLRSENVIVVVPQAPHQFYLDLETRRVGFNWLTAYDRKRGIADVVRMLDDILANIRCKWGLCYAKPVVMGFSQGVSIAYRYALYGENPVAGIIACGGDLPPDVEAALSSVDSFPVALVHGKSDAIVPFNKAEFAERVLQSMAFPVSSHYFDGGHEVPASLSDFLPRWLDETSGQ